MNLYVHRKLRARVFLGFQIREFEGDRSEKAWELSCLSQVWAKESLEPLPQVGSGVHILCSLLIVQCTKQ